MSAITIDGKLYIGHIITIKGKKITVDGELVSNDFENCSIKSDNLKSIDKSPRIKKLIENYNKRNAK